jgi:transcriptional regulator with XRE-family HTH domain
MMSSLYDRVAAKSGGAAALAAARLREELLVALHQAFEASGLRSKAELARRLNVRRSAVNQVFKGDGNLRATTIAEYLFALGFELDVTLVQAGEPRRAELEGRVAEPAHVVWNATISIVFIATPDQRGQLSVSTSAQPSQMWFLPSTHLAAYWEFDPVPNSTSGRVILGELVGD